MPHKYLPSPSMAVALLALFVAMGGSAYAVSKINGKDLKNRSVAGKKLEKHTLTGKEIDLSKLGTVPSATSAARASTASTASNALALGGLGPGAFLSAVEVRYSSPADGCATATTGDTVDCLTYCPAGEFAIAGGVRSDSPAVQVISDAPIAQGSVLGAGMAPVGWSVGIQNNDASPHGPTVYVICARISSVPVTEQPAGLGFG